MKKKSIISVVLAGVVALGLVGCGGASTSASKDSKNDKVIKIGVTPKPHEEIVNIAKPLLEKEGYTVEVTEFNDYNQPNTAVEEGSLDANFFQHTPYLNTQNKEKGYHLVSVGAIHLEPMGLYSKKIKSLDDLKEGATIAVPNDPSNEARALKLLAGKGLIKIKDGELVTPKDITENPKKLKFNELEAAAVPRAIDDIDAAVINGNYAIEAKFNPAKDAIIIEDKNSDAAKPYANIVVVKDGNQDKDKIKALVKAMTSPEVKAFIEKEYNGSVIPVF
ncbi:MULTISPECIES: MetQ/NlpA family ABC transporter substrate-binding protein [Clostridium]|jgi:D-methionine transport system substrate-binding protein|uniref:Lipoprotein n=1 Tax=Clostridium saccharoperbutylacetonicum N1-4(HMT) TaxID=931276 RepID=M1N623_9CLOT|nr:MULTISPECIES: MetQ/NlpA family ABC transporter substrate-binding protein [Clostridium]AGF58847.1 D-methionine-binding lipoprotein MetQ [Clostridium saccharoperbutylacetonicum N1-4(HMT)]AQR97528.1 D-methionine-binding lipoprotein MetQ precursor [Clostridium saccharoperbutylacetonicum]NRT60369.1 D-methionine transport system substrate-binding protein [Clostridium saccharoperbutylacetonicum]NSB23682.1 D-methionine transport system substrate-binding protein [Clostridium saccharoperbutylacetonicu